MRIPPPAQRNMRIRWVHEVKPFFIFVNMPNYKYYWNKSKLAGNGRCSLDCVMCAHLYTCKKKNTSLYACKDYVNVHDVKEFK